MFSPSTTALLPYLTAGLPDIDGSVRLFEAMAAAGADGFEIGIPYSDPLMDGPVIQQASTRALAAGMNLDRAFEVIQRVVTATGKPCLAMTYTNVVFRTGPDRFCERLAAAGAAGVIVPDLPVEETGLIIESAGAFGLDTVLFVAPTSSEERIAQVAELEPGFIYGVAEMGVTGEREESSGRAVELSRRVRSVTDIPLVLGVGISTPAQAAAAGAVADGVIVGTALVRHVLEADSVEAAADSLTKAVKALRAAL